MNRYGALRETTQQLDGERLRRAEERADAIAARLGPTQSASAERAGSEARNENDRAQSPDRRTDYEIEAQTYRDRLEAWQARGYRTAEAGNLVARAEQGSLTDRYQARADAVQMRQGAQQERGINQDRGGMEP